MWIHKIGRKNLSLNSNTQVCSDHFLAAGQSVCPIQQETYQQLVDGPFLEGKTQLEAEERWRYTIFDSLRIHVEYTMERIKNYRTFVCTRPSSLTDFAKEMLFVCAVMCNFLMEFKEIKLS